METATQQQQQQEVDFYTGLLKQAQAQGGSPECQKYVQELAEQRSKGRAFSEAETVFLRQYAKDPKKTVCKPPNRTGAQVGAICFLLTAFGLAIAKNFK